MWRRGGLGRRASVGGYDSAVWVFFQVDGPARLGWGRWTTGDGALGAAEATGGGWRRLALGQWEAFGKHAVDLLLRVGEDVDAYGGSGR